MPLAFVDFLRQLVENPALLGTVLLTLAVLLVNGWTDAPNAIAGAVVTGALPFRPAVVLAAVCNFLGVLCVTSVNASVAETVYSIASFGGGPRAALTALCAAMTAIVLWAGLAWFFGIPTSESHALVAGISGAAVALEGSFSCIRWGCWAKVGLGLLLSAAAGFWAGRAAYRRLKPVKASPRTLRLAQLPGAAAASFLHGAQDGQKFIGVFLLGAALAQGRADEGTFVIPLWLMILCALFMALGTLMGGKRIIDTVGREMVSLGPREGLAADLGSVACLLGATLLGLPVSTTHTRTCALLGVGSTGGSRPDWATAGKIALAWVLTFPGCMAIGYWMARVFLVM
ncbi:inorganic phosphate transporter [Colidextribacter sp. OB.20]|uniref:inorganic phosphate transporter n=1 Tax=Colidextribacter sp. OB.20 TaxID=2304568 RepID=UPI001368D1BC|nr:inorganic phosphate transporter [Colidextribacter sp. OB.20]NBI09855.1 inorganic phosphate transporter [Colidextribacter sp. OB.20]